MHDTINMFEIPLDAAVMSAALSVTHGRVQWNFNMLTVLCVLNLIMTWP